MSDLSWTLPVLVGAPLASAAVIGAVSTPRDTRASERVVVWASHSASALISVVTVIAIAQVMRAPTHVVSFTLGEWFSREGLNVRLVLDVMSAPLLGLTALLSGVVTHFSAAYLHREEGFARFFLMMSLFMAGMILLSLAGSMSLFFAGWEVVGLTSAMLIGFFRQRAAPVQHGLRALATYRACDVGLLLAVLLGAQGPGAPHAVYEVRGAHSWIIAFGLLLAAMGKSAQLPVGAWLPRAMEGPTPSSAIFYGALSIHAGVYLLARASTWMNQLMPVRVATIAVGLATTAWAAPTGRTHSDAKNVLAYASMAQVGVMFVEVGLGFPRLAMAHMVGHACLRTWQLLRAPSLLHDVHTMQDQVGEALPRAGGYFEALMPEALRAKLHAYAVQGFFVDDWLDAVFVDPVFRAARALVRFEASLLERFSKPAPSVDRSTDERREVQP